MGAAGVFAKRRSAGGRVLMTIGVAKESFRSNGSVSRVVAGVTEESEGPDGSVAAADGIAIKRVITERSFVTARIIINEGPRSNGGVLGASRVEKQRSSAHCRIKVAIVKTERYGANTGIPTSG